MKTKLVAALLAAGSLLPVFAQTPIVRTTTDEVLLDLVVRDKKGKPVTDLKPDDITVLDNDTRQKLTSFRLVKGAEALDSSGGSRPLDPLRQVRLVTLAFEPISDISQRKMARTAALDLIQGDATANVYYSVVAVDTRLFSLQRFTTDRAALTKAIELATEGVSAPRFASESEAITAELRRQLGQAGAGADVSNNLTAVAGQAASQPITNGDTALQAKLASVMLDMLRLDSAAGSYGARLTLSALKSLVLGLRELPGRKSVLLFTTGMYLTPELDVPFKNVISFANRENVTFYSVDVRGVSTVSQNAGATRQLNSATAASRTTVTRTEGAVTKDEMMAADNAEVSARANIDMPLRNLAESTGGFLIGDSNDLRVPLRQVNEEISSYYEVSYNPGIQTYDAKFRELKVKANRKDLVIHARSGYFALPPEARSSGLAPFEVPLLNALSSGKLSTDLKFRSGAVLLQPVNDGAVVSILLEIPLHELQAKRAGSALDVHCLLGALIKNEKGEVVQKITRDRSLRVNADQQRLGNFLEKSEVPLAPGKYTLEAVVIDQENNKTGLQHNEFTVPARAPGIRISSLMPMRAYAPNAKGMDAAEPFQFQGGSVTPTLDNVVTRAPNAALRLFFTVYPDSSVTAAPAVDVEFLQAGRVLTKVPMQLPAPDALGRIPYLMTIPAESIPAGTYEIRATARQGNSTSSISTSIRFE